MNRHSVNDVISETLQRDTAVVLPTLPHAIHWKAILNQAFKEHVPNDLLNLTKTAIVCRATATVMRLWVPYAREPTMPLDRPEVRRGFTFMNLYGYGEMVRGKIYT